MVDPKLLNHYLKYKVDGFDSVVDHPAGNHGEAESFHALGGVVGPYLG